MIFGPQAREWLARSIGAGDQLLEVVPLPGSTSSSVFLIQSSRGTETQRCVLRVLDNAGWLADEPDLAAHEAAALEEAQRAGLRAPRLVAYASDDAGFGAPVVLMSFLEGRIDLRPADFQAWLDGLARELAVIHQHQAGALAWRYETWVDKAHLAPPKWTANSHVWERAIALALTREPDTPTVFIHRDYHPTNVLWQAGAVSGVVDWINACRGPAGVDVAHCRTNLALMFGPPAADQFLDAYQALAGGFDYNPYWDVDSVLDCCYPEPGFYPPWAQFGLGAITPAALKQRLDAYLEGVLREA
jgi:aminoglycoside phosphotransferase (APT) family kinase protein